MCLSVFVVKINFHRSKTIRMKHIFGPVASRRLGLSLGLDITPFKTCTLDCVYCECGVTTLKTLERKPYVTTNDLIAELKEFLILERKIDYITFSGSGEPTLNSDIGKIIQEIKKIASTPIALLTNGTLLYLSEVRKEISSLDVILPSLDAASDKMFQIIDRPCGGIKIEPIIQGLIDLRKEYSGQIWLEILFLDGYNTEKEEVLLLKSAIEKIRPDRVQLNTVDRPPPIAWAKPVSLQKLLEIKQWLGFKNADIISHQYHPEQNKPLQKNVEETIINLLRRRPSTLLDIMTSTGADMIAVQEYLNHLQKKRMVIHENKNGKIFYKVIIHNKN